MSGMRSCFLAVLLGFALPGWAQSASPPAQSSPAKPAADSSPATAKAARHTPDLSPPHSDRVNADALGNEPGESSSKDTQIDLSPPEDDARAHPKSSDAVTDAEMTANGMDVGEFHPWDPHRAAKDVEVGDFYFKRKNYGAAESRYREALLFKDNDAIAIFRLAVCLEKMERPNEAQKEYEAYLRILPNGPEAEHARKALERLKTAADTK